jgi:hypothetical protein
MEENDLFAGAFISGDLTWKADHTEYYNLYGFLKKLHGWRGIDRYQVVICPGNHDIAFNKNPFYLNRYKS